VPLLPDVLELIELGMLTRGDKNNRVYVGDTVRFAESVTGSVQSALFDPQTAGGLLVSLDESQAEDYFKIVSGSVMIGSVRQRDSYLIEVN